jgi:hypothetical protein
MAAIRRFRIPLLLLCAGVACSDSTEPGRPADTTPPTVTISGPAAGGVSGTVTISVNTADDRGVRYVRWKVNSGLISHVDSSPPYSYDWDTTTFAAGFYDWQAVATDSAGNSATSPAVEYTVGP